MWYFSPGIADGDYFFSVGGSDKREVEFIRFFFFYLKRCQTPLDDKVQGVTNFWSFKDSNVVAKASFLI